MPDDLTPTGPKLVRPRIRAPGAGRPRKSAAMHALHGTRSRAPRPPKATDKPVEISDVPPELLTPPAWARRRLHRYGLEFWERNAPRLAAAGRLKLQHLDAWVSLCSTYAKMIREELALNRESSVASEMYDQVARHLKASKIRWAAECLRFGIDPASDVRLSALDGSEVESARGAVAPAPAAASEDRRESWLREHGRAS